MAEDPPKNEKTARLPASPTIPFPSKNGQRAAPIPENTPEIGPIRQPLDAIKRSDYRVPQPQKDGVLGIIVAVVAVLAILVAFGAAYWWLRR
jgi:transposase